MAEAKAVGKCAENHVGSYGYPTRPQEPYPFCPVCGKNMVWACAACGEPLPDDSNELAQARFCRMCGGPYFDEAGDRETEPGGDGGATT